MFHMTNIKTPGPVTHIYLYIIFSLPTPTRTKSSTNFLLSSDNVIEHSNPSRFLSAKIIGCADVELSNIIS
jgi:hypothetical protein